MNIESRTENVFYLKVVEAQLIFNKSENGDVNTLTLFQGGRELIGNRVENK